MIVHCAQAVAAELRSHAALAYPREACGLLVGRRSPIGTTIRACVPLANRAADGAFAIDPFEFLAAEKTVRSAGMALLGVFHSHPDGTSRPSRADLDRAWPEHLQVIVSVDGWGGTAIRAWQRVGGRLGAATFRIGPPVAATRPT